MMGRLVQRAAESDFSPGRAAVQGTDPGSCLVRFIAAYFDALRAAGLVERGEAYRAVADSIDSLDLPDLIAVNRFTGLTRPQERYVTAASTRAEVIVSLTYTASLPATEAAAALVSRLCAVGEMKEVAPAEPYSASPELIAIERDFSTQRPVPLVSSGAVRISEAWGRVSEAARIVAEIEAARASGIEPDGIAVVLRDPMAHVRALRFALDEAGVPVCWDVQVPFERTGFGRAMLGVLSVCNGVADRVTWMDLMRSPYSPASLQVLDDLDARIRRLGLGGTEATRRLDSWLSGETAAFMRQARLACSRLAEDGSEERWHRLAKTMIGRAHSQGAVLAPEGLLDAAAARALVDAVAGLRGLPYADAPTRMLGTALRGTPVSMGGTAEGGCVHVLSAERVRGRRFQCVIVGGLTADEFPRVRRDEGYGALGAEVALARAGIDTAPRDDVSAERLLFYQVITRARERLVLSRRSHDDRGQPVQPSIFLEEVLDLYGAGEGGLDPRPGVGGSVLGLDAGCSGEGAPSTSRRKARSAALMGEEGSEITKAAARPTAGRPRVHRDSAWRDTLSDDTRRALQHRDIFSVSDIETYLQCPYRWYIERVIRPADLDARVDASTAGQAAHEVLARTYDRFIETTGEPRVTPDTLENALAVLRSLVAEVVAGVHVEGAREVADLRSAVGSTARILTVDATLLPGFEPRYREWSFGMTAGDDAEPMDGYALRGRIDRIDCTGSHLFVMDYKLGAVGAERGVTRFAERGLVQLPLYAYVASKRLGLEVAGAVYRSIKHGDLRGFVNESLRGKPFVSTDMVGADGIGEVIQVARDRAYEAVRGMRAGAIDADPADGRCSPYCIARPFCPVGGSRHA
ncbi:MAG: PD-(D/E)XK nuclease family protein [Coriobacteriia bacterium]|nr:PD-(D/E)XK nuclease family protein [Coriobacteriia bacterium]